MRSFVLFAAATMLATSTQGMAAPLGIVDEGVIAQVPFEGSPPAGVASDALRDGVNIHGGQAYRRGAHAPDNFIVPHPRRVLNIHSVPAATTFRSLDARDRRAIQRRLAGYGFYHGKLDGIWGPMTFDAIVAYASNAGIMNLLADREGSYRAYRHLMN